MSTHEHSGPPLDVLCIGRVGVDLYPLRDHVALEKVETFQRYLGGSATNVAVAAARHGRRSAIVTRTGKDPFGRFVRSEVERLGVDTRFLDTVDGLLTPVAFCELFPPDEFPLYFYRQPSAPDLQVRPDELDLNAVASARLLWVTATGFSAEPSRSAHALALRTRAKRQHTVLDLDYRPSFWASTAEARDQISRAVSEVSVAVGNAAECEIAVGEADPVRAADALLAHGVELAIVKLGPRGVLAKTREESVQVPQHRVEVVNGLGAGDGFGGALCHGLLAGWPLPRVLEFANVAGAIVASRRECATAMPTAAEVERHLEMTR